MVKKTLISSLIAANMMTMNITWADTASVSNKPITQIQQNQPSQKAIDDLVHTQKDLSTELNKDIVSGFQLVVEATQLLQQEGKEKDALKKLQAATGKFDVALAANPELGLVAIERHSTAYSLLTTPDLLKKDINTAVEWLKDNKVQQARVLVGTLRDELVTTTTYLPMETYPDAIKLATKLLIKGKKQAAIETLATALSTFVAEDAITPLALVRAEVMIKEASELDKDKEKGKAKSLLTEAQDQLEVATLLGYTSKYSQAYQDLRSQIKALKKEIDGKNVVEKMYDKLRNSIHKLIVEEGKNEEQKKK